MGSTSAASHPHQARFQECQELAGHRGDSHFPGRILGKSGLRLVFGRLTTGMAGPSTPTLGGDLCEPLTHGVLASALFSPAAFCKQSTPTHMYAPASSGR